MSFIATLPRRCGPLGWKAGALALISMSLWGALGCGDMQPVAPADAPITDPAQLYRRLIIDYPAVNLSTAAGYNTAQLTALPHDAAGNGGDRCDRFVDGGIDYSPRYRAGGRKGHRESAEAGKPLDRSYLAGQRHLGVTICWGLRF